MIVGCTGGGGGETFPGVVSVAVFRPLVGDVFVPGRTTLPAAEWLVDSAAFDALSLPLEPGKFPLPGGCMVFCTVGFVDVAEFVVAAGMEVAALSFTGVTASEAPG